MPTPPDLLRADELAAVASIWKHERRAFTATFGGVSMLPTIAPGSPLEIVCGDDASPGDVILFLSRDQVVVHRLLAVRGSWALTRGDANAVPDQPVARQAVIGRATNVAPHVEAATQIRYRRIVAPLFQIAPLLARATVPLLWRARGLLRLFSARRLYGPAGLAARLWSKTLGVFFSVDIVLTLRLSTASVEFTPATDIAFARVSHPSPFFAEAARLLGVDPRTRGDMDACVAITPDGVVAGCAFNDRVDGPLAHQRGVAVSPQHRGLDLGLRLLRFQSAELARLGATAIEYQVGLTNRSSRRMLARLGAVHIETWIIVKLLRKVRIARRVDVRSATPS